MLIRDGEGGRREGELGSGKEFGEVRGWGGGD
jgi:hypothetical protein